MRHSRPSAGDLLPQLVAGAMISVRGALWKVLKFERPNGIGTVTAIGASGIAKGRSARFVTKLEPDLTVLHPADVALVPDESANFEDTKLHLAAHFSTTPPTGLTPKVLGQAAIDDLSFQHAPLHRALAQPRVRLLIGDDVGLGKTLEAGLVASELILRGRANRILVVTTRAMMGQFQKEFWTRFSIPLSRLDSNAIRRMRNRIPEHYNVFDQFERVIVSMDTLKRDGAIRASLETTRWDLVIIDEAHNTARRGGGSGTESLRARLAQLLSRTTDSLLLLTATPHDGSKASFASLIEMLDPTRVPDPEALTRDDIKDLVIRRFRSSREVIDAIKAKVPQRLPLERRSFPLGPIEDEAYRMVAEMRLDVDKDKTGRGSGAHLFRTTLAKAIFSSPAAALETVEGRLNRMASGKTRGTDADLSALTALRDQLRRIDASAFAKYQDLLAWIREQAWTGGDPSDRIVLFSERIATVTWLAENLSRDLGLKASAIARIDGGAIEDDERTRKIVEDFGQRTSPLRLLLASDMASEGLNLHFQAHRLIHFDLPWSLLRFQQRNGRIDRYGQERRPQIVYFTGESTHSRVRDMWVLEKLVEKDRAAQDGVGDPAVFFGVGDADKEEEITADAVAGILDHDAFDALLEPDAAQDDGDPEGDAFDDLLIGAYDGGDVVDEVAPGDEDCAPPRIYPTTFDFAAAMLNRLSRGSEPVLAAPPRVDASARVIRVNLPADMAPTDDFGYSAGAAVDDRFMPIDALPANKVLELTDDRETISTAIKQALEREEPWPRVQYLWDVHPIVGWLADHGSALFVQPGSRRPGVPFCSLKGRLPEGDIAVMFHGAISNRAGQPVVDRWGVVRLRMHDFMRWDVDDVADVDDFIRLVGLDGNLPNRGGAPGDAVAEALRKATEAFQDHIVALRSGHEERMSDLANERLDALAALQRKFEAQYPLPNVLPGIEPTSSEKRRIARARAKRLEIDAMFDDWAEWHRQTCELVRDPNPYVEIKAVFSG